MARSDFLNREPIILPFARKAPPVAQEPTPCPDRLLTALSYSLPLSAALWAVVLYFILR